MGDISNPANIPPHRRDFWAGHPGAFDLASKLRSEGRSASEIARELTRVYHVRVSRSSILGKLNRANDDSIVFKPASAPKRAVKVTAPPTAVSPRYASAKAEARKKAREAKPPVVKADTPAPKMTGFDYGAAPVSQVSVMRQQGIDFLARVESGLTATGFRLVDRPVNGCCNPTGRDGEEWLFCGAPVVQTPFGSSSWCATCRPLLVVRTEKVRIDGRCL